VARVWTSIRTSVLMTVVALCAVLLTVGPFDPHVAGVRAPDRPAAMPVYGHTPVADQATWDAFTNDLRGWDDDEAKLVSLGQADCQLWSLGVLPVGVPAATEGDDVADPKADAVADAARQHLCPELR
jgi:hypothetical protein